MRNSRRRRGGRDRPTSHRVRVAGSSAAVGALSIRAARGDVLRAASTFEESLQGMRRDEAQQHCSLPNSVLRARPLSLSMFARRGHAECKCTVAHFAPWGTEFGVTFKDC